MENVLKPIFKEVCFEDAYDVELLDDPDLKGLAERTGVESVKKYGEFNVPFNPVGVYEITVCSRVQMRRNRVGIQQIIHRIMSTYSSAFIIFHYNTTTNWDWRFTFCQKDDKMVTESKRYTFVLGPGQSCRTAAQNFEKLFAKQSMINKEDIVAAFDVEALSDEFFEKYKVFYGRFVGYIIGKEYANLGKGKGEWRSKEGLQPSELFEGLGRDEKASRDYVKKLLGRIVFLHFLQKKGWLGATDKDWTNGPQDFMKRLFFSATQAQKDDFLDSILEPLFSCLDTPLSAREEEFDTKVSCFGNVRVPFLGGIFERDQQDDAKSVFPAELFGGFFEFLSEYNFTIDENDPNDAQVGVDPEMLGRIFENLLEDNKDKGAFYTPKEIVQYMCRESLIAYLQTGEADDEAKEQIRSFVTSHDASSLPEDMKCLIDQKLKDVKICDPAIGSGAFPIGLLNELFLCRGALETFDDAVAIKCHIIQENIYGVDIEKGAVDIARLRFWLNLITDADKPYVLPNMDFKVMQGNSLLEQYKNIDLSELSTQTQGKVKIDKQLDMFKQSQESFRYQMDELLREYFSIENHEERQQLLNLIRYNVKDQIQAVDPNIDLDAANIDPLATSKFFLWHTWFKDVFDKGGFDIVIGNPPYVGVSKNDLYKDFETFSCYELYAYFYEKSLSLLKEHGIIAFITSSLFIKGPKFDPLRKLLTIKTSLIRLRNEGDDVFVKVRIPTVTFIARKEQGCWNFEAPDTIQSIARKMEYDANILSSISKIQRGFEIGRDRVSDVGDIEFLTGTTVQKFHYKKVVYISKEIFHEFAKEDLYFTGERILIRETGCALMAVYLDKKLYSNRSLYSIVITNKDFYPKYVTACLNSKLLQFYYQTQFKSDTKLFPKIRIVQAKKLPIHNASLEKQNEIISKVDLILTAKKADPEADTSALEHEIDLLVYDIYGLTDDEIAIVEGATN